MNEPPLYEHESHWYEPRNANEIHEEEQTSAGFNQRVAIFITSTFQNMNMFWLIIGWFVTWIVVNATMVTFDPLPWPLLLTLASIPQLPLMVVIMIGQSILGRKQEIHAEQAYQTTLRTYHDLGEIANHLHAQDELIFNMIARLEELRQIQQQKPARVPAPKPKKKVETKEEVA